MVNDLKKINESPSDTVIVHKVLKCLPMKYEIFVRILRTEKETPSLASLASKFHIEETEMALRAEINEEALVFKIRNLLRGR